MLFFYLHCVYDHLVTESLHGEWLKPNTMSLISALISIFKASRGWCCYLEKLCRWFSPIYRLVMTLFLLTLRERWLDTNRTSHLSPSISFPPEHRGADAGDGRFTEALPLLLKFIIPSLNVLRAWGGSARASPHSSSSIPLSVNHLAEVTLRGWLLRSRDHIFLSQ